MTCFRDLKFCFLLIQGLQQGTRSKVPATGVASLNLAEYAAKAEEKEFEVILPLTVSISGSETLPSLSVSSLHFLLGVFFIIIRLLFWSSVACVLVDYLLRFIKISNCTVFKLQISLSLLELRTAQELAESVQGCIMPIVAPPQSGETLATQKDELSAIKAGLKKVKIFTEYVSTRKAKKACHEGEGSDGRCSARSEDGEYTSQFDSDSLDDFEEGESDDVKEGSNIRKSFCYGKLAYANCAGGSFYSSMRICGEDEDLIYYSNPKLDLGCLPVEDSSAPVSEPSLQQSSKRSILPWRKRKLSFRSPKAKGEPLLKKAYGEEGGDDIDFDRRQLSSDESLHFGVRFALNSILHGPSALTGIFFIPEIF